MSALMQGPESTDRFSIATKGQTVYVHAKKHCACGKVVSLKQLTQYGRCVQCVRASK